MNPKTKNPRALNPLMDELRADSDYYATRAASGDYPRLFASGDLPPYTASGNPPQKLMELPWQLRHAAAKADQAEWARLFNEYGSHNPDADLAIMYEPAAADPANDEYRGRITAWKQHGR